MKVVWFGNRSTRPHVNLSTTEQKSTRPQLSKSQLVHNSIKVNRWVDWCQLFHSIDEWHLKTHVDTCHLSESVNLLHYINWGRPSSQSVQYLPAKHITPVFEQLQAKASNPALQALCEYIRATWINSPTWPTASWSVFTWATWTNNDVEGWHRCINHHAKKSNLPFYVLVKLLHEEADSINITVHLLSENNLHQHQCKH